MKKENLLSKWLDHDLTDTEQEAFEQTDAFRSYHQIDRLAQAFKAPDFEVEKEYASLQKKMQTSAVKKISWKHYAFRIAAVFVIAFGMYWALSQSSETTFTAHHAEQISLELPDASEVILNAGSQLAYDKDQWDASRNVTLSGEAYFKVAKGKQFSVATTHGIVSVKGTQFNVTSRPDYFEVTCFEGEVVVALNNETHLLKAGRTLRWSNDTLENQLTALIEPTWLQHKSVFKSVPLQYVLEEIERQYDITIDVNDIDTTVIFTGSFTHKNLPTALEAITIPLTLSYEINDDKTVVLKSE